MGVKRGASLRKSLLLGIIILIVVMGSASVLGQTTPSACNNAGGIWCGTVSGGSCSIPQTNPPTGYGNKVCSVSITDQLVVLPSQGLNYVFKDFTIEGATTISFISSQNGICPVNFQGGTGGSRGGTTGSGKQGGNGGAGGDVCSVGTAGNSGTTSGGSAGRAGGYIKITAQNIMINGILNLSGEDGNNGVDATGQCCSWTDYCGCGGGGGGAGGGAGVVEFTTSNDITGIGQILVDGGKGGVGGKQTNDQGSGTQCAGGSGNDAGGAGGGGGGGAAGAVLASAPVLLAPSSPGGAGGKGGCQDYGLAESGKPGSPGQGNIEPVTFNQEFDCNNGVDDDGDLLVDMDDFDCFITKAAAEGWDTSIRAEYEPVHSNAWYNPSALTGSDLSCGDDVSYTCTPDYSNCSVIPNALCSDYASVGCFLDSNSGSSGYCTGSTSASCGAFNSIDDGACTPDAPYPCQSIMTSFSGCGGYGVEPCYTCDGQFSCLDIGEDPLCTDGGCTWVPTTTTVCTGEFNIDCGDYDTQSTCEGNVLCNYYNNPNAQQDLGYTVDMTYACFDNRIGTSTAIQTPGNDYLWRASNSYSKLIMQAGNTQFISNGPEWYFCAADGVTSRYNANPISEGGTFQAEFGDGTERCTQPLDYVMTNLAGLGNYFITDCAFGITNAQCYTNAVNNVTAYSQKGIFCYWVQDGVDKRAASYSPWDGGFSLSECQSVCFYTAPGQSPTAINSVNFLSEDICELTNDLAPGCKNPGTGQSGYSLVDQDYCFNSENIAECLGALQDTGSTCAEIIGTGYVSEERLCSQTEYCDNGLMMFSTENGQNEPVKQCCFGENAQCNQYSSAVCAELGGVEKPVSQQDIFCTGQEIGDNPKCCVGGVWEQYNPYAFQTAVNESFMCYSDGNKNLIRECCSSGLCENSESNNPLNIYDSTEKLYVYEGSNTHSLISFDTDTGKKVWRVTGMGAGDVTEFSVASKQFALSNWSEYSYLYFDMASNSPFYDRITLIGPAGERSFNIDEYSVMGRAYDRINRIGIPLSSLSPDLISNVNRIRINYSGPQVTNVAYDNFYLEPKTVSSATDNYYCTGIWKKWVDNLDGPTDQGFYGQTPTFTEYGPYRMACGGPFSWTGTICCGDDTTKTQGEYVLDTNALCWNGLTVSNDKTAASVKGASAATQLEKSILYYPTPDKKVWLCNMDVPSTMMSFNQNPTNTPLLSTSNSERVEPFSVMGSWLCDPEEGWITKDQYNRARILAGTLYEIGKKATGDELTLFCGNFMNVSNDVEAIKYTEEAGYTDTLCLLRTGKNNGAANDIYLGLEINKLRTFEEYNTSILRLFNPTIGWDITCEVDDNPKNNETFKICASSGNDLVFYYNKPFNLLIIGTNVVTGVGTVNSNDNTFIGFIVEMWSNLKQAFYNLFYSGTEFDLPITFEENSNIKDFYIAEQGDKNIVGLIETRTQTKYVRVDYTGLSNSVEMLAKAIENNYPVNATYVVDNDVQTIYLEIDYQLDFSWNLLTGIVRLN